MMGFIEWVEFNNKKKTKEKKHERPNGESGQENGAINHQRQADRANQEVESAVVHIFPEPQ